MRRSDIFESFVKIAEEKGLVSKASPESVKETLEKTHRADSLSIEDIAHLYNTKPATPKEMEYKRNIVEIAHPEPQVLFNSYDKLNSLVENVNERQDIILNILNRTPNGQITQKKYAKRDLILSLVRVGNEMDTRGQSDLVALADACLFRASKPIHKQAQLGIISAIAFIVCAFYAKQHLRFHSDGFALDYQKATAELNDLLNSSINLQTGYEYTPAFIVRVKDIRSKLNRLNIAVKTVLPELDKLETPRTGKELMEMAKQPNTHQVLSTFQDFKTQFQQTAETLVPYLSQVIANFQNEDYKQRQIQNKGWFTSMIDSAAFLHGGWGLVADDFDDAAHALQTIMFDVANIEKDLRIAEQAATKAQETMAQSAQPTAPEDHPSTFQIPLPTSQQLGGTPANPVERDQKAELEQEMSNLKLQDLLGG